ncbi:helix-turn-helix transcriptional regulator [uncultured Slackia sp.]|uniref:helix-turn-helix transcriptional regulator n=1 Tax=uncultured Slackia sp. TaxID=665903 RepID=UPI0025EF3670|nr:helix-turn-helix transcriptional regulator [uncultured Slackia sp.]
MSTTASKNRIASFASSAPLRLKRGLAAVRTSPYLCLALISAWHYSLWFVPNATGLLGITSFDVTFVWLLTLGFAALFLLTLPFGIKRIDTGEHLGVVPIAAGVLSAATLAFCLVFPFVHGAPFYAMATAIACLFGLCQALIWIFGGASCSRAKATFAVRDVALTFALVTVVAMAASMVLPTPAAAVLAAAFPIASAIAYRNTMARSGGCPEPVLLPQKSSKALRTSAIVILVTGGMLSIADTFATCIIPTELTGVLFHANVLAWTLAGGVIIISVALLLYASRFSDGEPYSLVPVLMALSIVALVFVVKSGELAVAAFALGMGICVCMEILMLTFFGALATRGYMAPAIAFGVSEGIMRLGSTIGNSAAVFFEQNNLVSSSLTADTCLLGVCVIGFLIIAATRQQHALTALASAPLSVDEVDTVCEDAAAEFGLSPRETEVLKLLARNHSIDSIAKKFVISPYTVQTHIQHIYRKLHVHRRSELLDYINLRRDAIREHKE